MPPPPAPQNDLDPNIRSAEVEAPALWFCTFRTRDSHQKKPFYRAFKGKDVLQITASYPSPKRSPNLTDVLQNTFLQRVCTLAAISAPDFLPLTWGDPERL